MPSTKFTEHLDDLLRDYDASKPEAFDELIQFSVRRLEALVRRRLGQEEYVHRWEQTDDVL
ncbi:MAG: hypothetical protein Q4G59_01350 [Planctomycetia bacterium]|nr:hypothetical protein [Planctomycetia bacterium]